MVRLSLFGSPRWPRCFAAFLSPTFVSLSPVYCSLDTAQIFDDSISLVTANRSNFTAANPLDPTLRSDVLYITQFRMSDEALRFPAEHVNDFGRSVIADKTVIEYDRSQCYCYTACATTTPPVTFCNKMNVPRVYLRRLKKHRFYTVHVGKTRNQFKYNHRISVWIREILMYWSIDHSILPLTFPVKFIFMGVVMQTCLRNNVADSWDKSVDGLKYNGDRLISEIILRFKNTINNTNDYYSCRT